MLDIVWMLIAAFFVFRAGRRDIVVGFCLTVALCVSLPATLAISTTFTVQRILLAVVFIVWLQVRRRRSEPGQPPILTIMVAMILARGVSLFLSITPGSSLKDWISYGIETVLFYRIASSILTSPEAGLSALRALCFGLTAVAVVTVVERYTGINLPVILVSSFKYLNDGFQSTYPHRILLGYAMAMGLPITLCLVDLARTKKQQRLVWLIAFLLAVACFLADSRGGWIGMAIGGLLTLVLGSARTRKRSMWILVLAVITIALRPGIRETIVNRAIDTFAEDSYRGMSYSYRWKLWHVAFSEISKSPERLLFGYGGLSTESMDLSQYFGHEEGHTATKIGYTSWDNNYAADLIEFGIVGLSIEIILYSSVVVYLFMRWKRSEGAIKGMLGGLIASCVVYLFARSNVYVFAAQLEFLFWSIVAVGCVALRARPGGERSISNRKPNGAYSLAH
jgi:O-antigen ligase